MSIKILYYYNSPRLRCRLVARQVRRVPPKMLKLQGLLFQEPLLMAPLFKAALSRAVRAHEWEDLPLCLNHPILYLK
jgi:hypothetical protein